MIKIEKSINEMNDKELQEYISNRINRIKLEIATNEKNMESLNREISENIKTIKIVENTRDAGFLVNIGKRYGVDLNPDPLFLNLLKVILTDHIERENLRIEENVKEIKKSTLFYRSDLSKIDTCPLCAGMGQKIEVEYLRQEGTVQQIRHIKECHGCHGTGKIFNLSQ